MEGRRWRSLSAALAAVAALATAAPAPAQTQTAPGGVYARVGDDTVVLGNAVAERTWSRDALRTVALADKRRGGVRLADAQRDFTLAVGTGGQEIASDSFRVESAAIARLPRGGLRVTMRLAPRDGGPLRATRVAEAYPGIAGFRTQTTLEADAPLTLSSATLDEVAAPGAAATTHAFRSGADWRNPDWPGPPLWVGYAHPGDWRDSRRFEPGAGVEEPAQWLSLAARGRSLFMIMERNDFPSSRVSYDGRAGALRADWSRDVIMLGPLESEGHVENPGSGAGRTRTVAPGRPFPLEAAFTGFGASAVDEPWQFNRYLAEHRIEPYAKSVNFNSYRTQDGSRSTGAHDDMDFAALERSAPVARRLGVENFVLDDGWQAVSGDWEPSSPEHPDPRWDGQPGSKLAPRYPDADFSAARRALAPMKLGLWMSPLEFHPSARTYREHPEWLCSPVGEGVLAQHLAQPDEGSNESGIVPWSRAAIPHFESRVRHAIARWDVRYFKFDFMVWLDCAGENDLYELHDEFLAMVDRLRRDHPEVTIQLDETNDYRLFPFESIVRGPSWFQNGTRPPELTLHNLWQLAPFVPPYSIGQHVLGGEHHAEYPVSTLMAAGLASHMTVWTDLRKLPDDVVDAAATWLGFYKRHRPHLAQMAYPLLADPLERGWTALQPWDPERGRGALIAFRQDSGEATRRIALVNVPPRRRFALYTGPRRRHIGTVSSAALTRGILVTLPSKRASRVIVIEPAQRRARPPRRAQPPRGNGDRGPRFTG